jgi:hypothetical protein
MDVFAKLTMACILLAAGHFGQKGKCRPGWRMTSPRFKIVTFRQGLLHKYKRYFKKSCDNFSFH